MQNWIRGKLYCRNNQIGKSHRPFLAAVLIGLLLNAASAWAINIDNGIQNGALDQPQVNVAISLDGANPLHSPDGSDPETGATTRTINFQAYYDTGASGILLSSATASSFGLTLATSGGSNIVYSDVGVGGSQNFNVSQPLYIHLASNNPTISGTEASLDNFTNYSQTFGQVQAQVSQDVVDPSDPLGSLTATPDVVGTPAMAGKVVVIDSVAINRATNQLIQGDINNIDLNDLSLRTYVYNPGTPFVGGDTNPGIPTSNFHVKLASASFARFTTVTPSGAQGPTLANNPFIGPNPVAQLDPNAPANNTPKVKIIYNNQSAEGSFLLDTGSATSMISNNLASQLNIVHQDPTDPSSPLELKLPDGSLQIIPDQFNLTVSGIGANSNVTRPGFFLDSLLVHTMEATTGLDDDPNNLNFLHVPVLVDDIQVQDPVTGQELTLDGIFGMNMLTATEDASGDILNSLGALGIGAFDYITFDQPNGILGLSMDVSAVPEPSTFALAGFAAIGLVVVFRRAKIRCA